MNLSQFLADNICVVDIPEIITSKYVITSKVVNRITGNTILSVQTIFNYNKMSQKIADSQTLNSLVPFDWEKVIDHTKRAHLDYFAQRMPIDNYYPLDTNINITNMYK